MIVPTGWRPERARDVGVARGHAAYDAAPPYSPGIAWPEHTRLFGTARDGASAAYATVRDSLRLLGLDAARFGSAEWNPLQEFVHPGDTVVVKPNLVREYRESSPDHADCLTTHGAVIRAVVDYVFIALGGQGRIIVADAPISEANFAELRRIAGLDDIADFYRRSLGFGIEIYDLRPEAAIKIDGVIVGHQRLAGDPAGYAVVDLGPHSTFVEVGEGCRLLYGSEYDRSELVQRHVAGRHQYLISKTVLEADCVISVPKLKTHKKVGVTVNLKNLVGINGNKNWLPHHREGTPSQGGDQFADDRALRVTEQFVLSGFRQWFPRLGPIRPLVAKPIKLIGKRVFGDSNTNTVRSGNWYGNDTAWRMAQDLNRILFYADRAGRLLDAPQRRFFSIVDGIVAGEGNGPLDPRPRRAGLVLAGCNPVAVDAAAARLMGFDASRLPILHRAYDDARLVLAPFDANDIRVCSNVPEYDGLLTALVGPGLGLEPHFGWKGHIEIQAPHEAGVLA
jgi:uncharacterized protein (DUF362 family)